MGVLVTENPKQTLCVCCKRQSPFFSNDLIPRLAAALMRVHRTMDIGLLNSTLNSRSINMDSTNAIILTAAAVLLLRNTLPRDLSIRLRSSSMYKLLDQTLASITQLNQVK